MTKTQKLALFILFLIQVWVAASFELAHDEAYYWLYSKNLDWGYFDHPPFVGILIRLFSFLPLSEIGIRLGFIVTQFLSLILLLKLVPARTYSWVILAFFAFPLASFSGLLALPDMPLLFMTAVYCYLLKGYLEKDDVLHTLSLGVAISLLLYAKYHGILLIFFTLIAVPKLILRKSFYVVALISIALFLPHVWWQYQHDFATLKYHFIERPKSAFSFKRSLEFLGIQILLAGVFSGPVIWWKTLKFKTQNSFDRSMKAIAFGIVVFFLISTFSKKFEANWTISIAFPLIYLSAYTDMWSKKWVQGLAVTSFALVFLARFLFVVPAVEIKRLKEFRGWKKWSQEMQAKCSDGKLMANTYQLTSKLSFYLNEPIHSLNYHSRKNQFDFWRFDKTYPTEKVCYITDASNLSGETIFTPEGKKLNFISDKTLNELQDLKANN
jgi:hypothetical protein